jgi:hypothetical protein
VNTVFAIYLLLATEAQYRTLRAQTLQKHFACAIACATTHRWHCRAVACANVCASACATACTLAYFRQRSALEKARGEVGTTLSYKTRFR